MATRTVRFDHETEEALNEVRAATGWPISEVMKRGVQAMRESLRRQPKRLPYDIYDELDLGAGGYAIVSSADTRSGMRLALKKKLGR